MSEPRTMKEDEIRKAALCAGCGEKFGRAGLLFYRLRIERFGVKTEGLQRNAGLAAMLGSAQLARVMGPDEDMAVAVMEPRDVTICDQCAGEGLSVHTLAGLE